MSKIVSFDKAIELRKNGYIGEDCTWFYVTSDRLLQKYDRGSSTEIYHKGDKFYNDVDSMVIEGDCIPAPTKRQMICFKLRNIIKKL